MTVNDLIGAIHNSNDETIKIKRNKVCHGNDGGVGDYQTVTLTVGQEEFKFRSTNTGWEPL